MIMEVGTGFASREDEYGARAGGLLRRWVAGTRMFLFFRLYMYVSYMLDAIYFAIQVSFRSNYYQVSLPLSRETRREERVKGHREPTVIEEWTWGKSRGRSILSLPQETLRG